MRNFKQPAAETPQESGNSNAEKNPVTGATEMLRDDSNVDTERNLLQTPQRCCETTRTLMRKENVLQMPQRCFKATATLMLKGNLLRKTQRLCKTIDKLMLKGNLAALSVDENCLMKPKMLKFKKEKDGKLTIARSKIHTKTRKKETECKVSPLEIVGNDPDSESQTLQSYLDDECERGRITKAEMQHGDMEKIGRNTDDCKPRDRGFFASLQDADVECVAVVCKKTSSRTGTEQ